MEFASQNRFSLLMILRGSAKTRFAWLPESGSFRREAMTMVQRNSVARQRSIAVSVAHRIFADQLTKVLTLSFASRS